ncbi:RNase H domain-containing protein [Trichonephila clavipes]|uniref:RNase H domain-containing protein n=1 Tax=Trichonephila clavipes TaxID=2585209 RepID=A0A8X7BHR8_TRICX|nr:RNase H domain-containing protein [Trichonephila clavipes]
MRQDQTLLARFRSGLIKSMKFAEGRKSFEMCTNCSTEPTTPTLTLECLGLTKQDLAEVPLLMLDFLKVYDVMDLERSITIGGREEHFQVAPKPLFTLERDRLSLSSNLEESLQCSLL